EQASFVPVEDRAAEVGDTVTVNITGKFLDDDSAEPISADDLQIELGAEGVEQTFTDNLLGAKPDDERTFTVNYPEDFTSPGLAGKSVEYTAKVNSVGRIELPEINDEWAASLDEGYESLANLREKLRQDLESMVKYEADNKMRDELMNKLIDANPVEAPPSLVNYQAQGLTRQFAGQLEQQGMDLRKADEKVWQMLYQRMLPQAEREVGGALLLEEIAVIENIEVSDEEINAEIEAIAQYSQQTPEEVRAALTNQNGENSIADRLRNRKAIETLVDNAVVTEGEWIDEQQAAMQTEETTEETSETGENNVEESGETAAEEQASGTAS
ncbi:MAG TPA: trigger factor, partial [Pyrinomonadaceae bacterium]|nr:trigger factor [Pyrinomonadaceae bacterium]